MITDYNYLIFFLNLPLPSSLRRSCVMRHHADHRRFLYYLLYAWTTPLALTAITMAADQYKFMPDKWNPEMATNSCFFDRE